MQIELGGEELGFRTIGWGGVHSSRTLMLADLRLLLEVASPTATSQEYKDLILSSNVLSKKTQTTREEAWTRLRRLYALDHTTPVFNYFRYLWYRDEASRPLLALLLAIARDPLLRLSISVILTSSEGEVVTKDWVMDALQSASGDHFNETTRATIVRNILSSWTQAGFLQGEQIKVRHIVGPAAAGVAYAAYLAFLCGVRGSRIFESGWVSMLGINTSQVQAYLKDA
jgi:hypothetical protein